MKLNLTRLPFFLATVLLVTLTKTINVAVATGESGAGGFPLILNRLENALEDVEDRVESGQNYEKDKYSGSASSEPIPVEDRPENLAKVREKSESYQINIRNSPRRNKNLLVLDIDYTIMDSGLYVKGMVAGVDPDQLVKCARRPYLHQFLARAYKDYDIVIWSATSLETIVKKLNFLGVDSDPSYKILFYLDISAVISVDSPKFGRVRRVKPLALIWNHFPQYSFQNTIMVDDSEKNFVMNPQSGLTIEKFDQGQCESSDNTLLRLTQYLKRIVNLRDFTRLDHSKWESMVTPSSTRTRMVPVKVEVTKDYENDILISDID